MSTGNRPEEVGQVKDVFKKADQLRKKYELQNHNLFKSNASSEVVSLFSNYEDEGRYRLVFSNSTSS